MIVVIGPLHAYPGLRWCFNTCIPGDLRGPLREQAFLGSYHAVPGPFPESYAAKIAARMNQDPVVEIYHATRGHSGRLQRLIRVPDQWLEAYCAVNGFARVCAEVRAGLVPVALDARRPL